MCGICGKRVFNGPPVSVGLIQNMASRLRHRGRDDEGFYVDSLVGLGQRRLSIIDVRPDATPPLTNEEGTIRLVLNGEIYNFQDLRAQLQARGHTFQTRSDTEVIVHAYEEYGHDCVRHFNGMFSFALWDSQQQELFCARDRFGKKPFFYSFNGHQFWFASECKAITADPDFSAAADYGALDIYLSYGFIPSPLSAFKGISKLPPAHRLVCRRDGRVRVERYWAPPERVNKTPASVPEIQEELQDRLREAVRLRMISDVPLGAFLSGGLDSTTIVALMAGESARPIKTFSIGFTDATFNELPAARLLAERYGTDHHEFVVEPQAGEILPQLVWHHNEPFADSSALPTFYVSKLTREHVTVALSGDGGDETFAGYGRYGTMAAWCRAAGLLRPLRPALQLIEKTANRLPGNHTARLARAAYMLGHNLPAQYRLQMSSGLKPQEKQALYSASFRERILDAPSRDPLEQLLPVTGMHPIDYCMNHDQHFYLPEDLMVKTDIASMANSLEVRSPLLDYELVEFAATIPVHLKYQNGLGKQIFRQTFGSLLPPTLLSRPKSGFAVPLRRWLGNELNSLLRDHLLDSTARSRNLFDQSAVARMITEHEQGIRFWENRLYALLFLEIWFRLFID